MSGQKIINGLKEALDHSKRTLYVVPADPKSEFLERIAEVIFLDGLSANPLYEGDTDNDVQGLRTVTRNRRLQMARVVFNAMRSKLMEAACDPEKTYGNSRGVEYLQGYIEGRQAARTDIDKLLTEGART